MSEAAQNEAALRELDADNARRSAQLEAKGARIRNVQSGYTNYLVETLIAKQFGPEALTEVQLGYSGVVSRMLDEAEKQVDEAELRSRISLPGQPW